MRTIKCYKIEMFVIRGGEMVYGILVFNEMWSYSVNKKFII